MYKSFWIALIINAVFKYHQETLVTTCRYDISIREARQDMKEEGLSLDTTSYVAVTDTGTRHVETVT